MAAVGARRWQLPGGAVVRWVKRVTIVEAERHPALGRVESSADKKVIVAIEPVAEHGKGLRDTLNIPNPVVDRMVTVIATELVTDDYFTTHRLNAEHSAILLCAASTRNDLENRHDVKVA